MPGTAFITGGTGFIGRAVAERLVESGWKVTALHRPSSDVSALLSLGVDLSPGDLLDRASLEEGMPSGVDAVFHLGGDTSTWARNGSGRPNTNVDGTRNLVAAALCGGARAFVHTSTWNVFGIGDRVISEEGPRLGLESPFPYTRSKSLAEEEVINGMELGLRAFILNPSHVIGRYDTRNWSKMITLVDEERVPGVPGGSGSFAWVRSVAEAHLRVIERGRPGQRYLLGGCDASFLEVFRTIAEILGRRVPSRPVPAFATRALGSASAWVASVTRREPEVTPEIAHMVTRHPRVASDRAERELGYSTVSLREMLVDCIDWMRETGRLRGAAI
jgi:dihydroflavonol-4-reductase